MTTLEQYASRLPGTYTEVMPLPRRDLWPVVYTLEEACGEPWRRIPNLGGRWFEMTDGHLTAGSRVDLISDGTLSDVL